MLNTYMLFFYLIVWSDFLNGIKYPSETYTNFTWVGTIALLMISTYSSYFQVFFFSLSLQMMLRQMLLSSLCPAVTSSFWALTAPATGEGVPPQPSPQTEADSWGQLQRQESALAHPKGQGNPVFPVRWEVQSLQIKQNWEDKSH